MDATRELSLAEKTVSREPPAFLFDEVCAENGRRAVALLTPFRPDLLVTDLVMPEMDGIALIREAKRLRPDLGILAISAGGHYGRAANYLKWAAELGADEVLTKPF